MNGHGSGVLEIRDVDASGQHDWKAGVHRVNGPGFRAASSMVMMPGSGGVRDSSADGGEGLGQRARWRCYFVCLA